MLSLSEWEFRTGTLLGPEPNTDDDLSRSWVFVSACGYADGGLVIIWARRKKT